MAVISSWEPRTSAVAAREDKQGLVAALRNPAAYPHPAPDIEVIETHISWVVLAGEYAYKIKKPVHLPFVDFTTLAARRFYCAEEVRLNRRTAPEIYLGVVAITGDVPRVHVGGAGPVLEYAVRMRRFDGSELLARRALEHFIQPEQVDALALAVARFHDDAPRADPESAFGAPETIVTAMLESLSDIAELQPDAHVRETLNELHDWARTQHQLLYSRFARRKADGHVRECHGDLHLGNVVLIDGAPVLFDALEFNERLRWGDAISEVAFLVMDMLHHELPRQAWRFLNRYLDRTGDHGAIPLLRYYMTYRAIVRAKVAAIRAAQLGDAAGPRAECAAYLALARRLAHRGAPLLAVMQGYSCSGKTTVSQRLAEALGAIRIRSDIERKRMAGAGETQSLAAPPGEGAYSGAENGKVYTRLARIARDALEAGWPVLVDAAFLERGQRDAFRDVARDAGAAFEIVRCDSPVEVLRARAELRTREGRDASDAGADVLGWQLAHAEPLAPDERLHSVAVDTMHANEWQGAIENLARRFSIVAP